MDSFPQLCYYSGCFSQVFVTGMNYCQTHTCYYPDCRQPIYLKNARKKNYYCLKHCCSQLECTMGQIQDEDYPSTECRYLYKVTTHEVIHLGEVKTIHAYHV